MRQPAVPVAQLPFNELKELQQLLVRAGFNVGKVDGVMGQLSRTAVKAMQVKYGLPADSWPTAELLARMRGPGVTGAARRHGDAGGAVVRCHSPRRRGIQTPRPVGNRNCSGILDRRSSRASDWRILTAFDDCKR